MYNGQNPWEVRTTNIVSEFTVVVLSVLDDTVKLPVLKLNKESSVDSPSAACRSLLHILLAIVLVFILLVVVAYDDFLAHKSNTPSVFLDLKKLRRLTVVTQDIIQKKN